MTAPTTRAEQKRAAERDAFLAYVQEVITKAPPLTDAQIERLAQLFFASDRPR